MLCGTVSSRLTIEQVLRDPWITTQDDYAEIDSSAINVNLY